MTAAYPMDETHKFDFVVYELSLETYRHPCQAFILFSNKWFSKRLFIKQSCAAPGRNYFTPIEA
jgi:hypothetical protein